jgi:alkylation response protein AidB-like acyl-CoA dehydrogenase
MGNSYQELSGEIIGIIRQHSISADKEGRLSPEQLQLIFDQKWFHLFVPKEFGGLALSLPAAVRLEESIAYADGSVGWVVTLCAGAAMFIGYFEDLLAKEIFYDPEVCLAGSGRANGIARVTEQGFRINGEWPYASGAPHATHFTANCVIEGSREIQSFIFKREEVTIRPDWHYIGLNATAGYSFSVKDLDIPARRMFTIDADHALLPDPVYRYPFLQLAQTTIAANMSGMCRHFFDLAFDLLSKKKSSNEDHELIKKRGLDLIISGNVTLELLRESFYKQLDQSWALHISTNTLSAALLDSVSLTSKQLSKGARDLVNELYPYCGMEAAKTNTAINQVWRDINTSSQHPILLM